MFRKLLHSLVLCLLLASLFLVVQPAAAIDVPTGALTAYLNIDPKYSTQYFWSIDKTSPTSSLLLSPRQFVPASYSVTVNASAPVKTISLIYANVTITNSTGADATVNGVSFAISPNYVAMPTNNCYLVAGGSGNFTTYSFTLPAGAAVQCDLFITPASTGEHTVTASVNTSPAVVGNLSAYTGDFVGQNLGMTDECITVTDTLAGNLGIVCANDAPKTFTYTHNIGGYGTCGMYQVNNTAAFVTNDTLTQGSDSWIVNIDIPCAGGCSLTPGYWKTHSSYGPAPYDDTWALLPAGADSTFFLSGASYYNVLWTAPKGNAYYILAHAYIAAVLNNLNGADTSAVDGIIAQATTFFQTHTPDASLTKAERNMILKWASTLDNYNNGLIGPGHCSE